MSDQAIADLCFTVALLGLFALVAFAIRSNRPRPTCACRCAHPTPAATGQHLNTAGAAAIPTVTSSTPPPLPPPPVTVPRWMVDGTVP